MTPTVEEIARIIDPETWALFDKMSAEETLGRFRAFGLMSASRAKAAAILALLPSPEPTEGWVMLQRSPLMSIYQRMPLGPDKTALRRMIDGLSPDLASAPQPSLSEEVVEKLIEAVCHVFDLEADEPAGPQTGFGSDKSLREILTTHFTAALGVLALPEGSKQDQEVMGNASVPIDGAKSGSQP